MSEPEKIKSVNQLQAEAHGLLAELKTRFAPEDIISLLRETKHTYLLQCRFDLD